MLFGSSLVAQAAQVTATWIGGSSGNWSVPTNWSTGVVPNNSGGTTYNVIIDNSATTASVQLNGNFTIDALAVNAGDSLTFANASRLTVVNQGAGTGSGTINNAGAITINSGGNNTDLVIQGDVTLNGGGTVTMSNTGANRIFGASGTDRLTNSDNYDFGRRTTSAPTRWR